MSLLVISLLLSEITVIKIEAHVKRNTPEYRENVPADFPAKAASKKTYKDNGTCG